MLISIPEAATELSPPALVLLVVLAAHPPRAVEVNIRQQDLTVATKSSRSTVQRALSELQQAGLLEVVHRGATAPILRLPWREPKTLTPDNVVEIPAQQSSIDRRLAIIEDRLAAIENKQTFLFKEVDQNRKMSNEAFGEYTSKEAVQDAASKDHYHDATSKEADQGTASKEVSGDALKTAVTSAISKRREQHTRDLKPKVGPEAKVTDEEILELTKQHEHGLTRSIVAQAFDVSEQAAKRYIKRALDAGVLRVEGQSRACRYFRAAADS